MTLRVEADVLPNDSAEPVHHVVSDGRIGRLSGPIIILDDAPGRAEGGQTFRSDVLLDLPRDEPMTEKTQAEKGNQRGRHEGSQEPLEETHPPRRGKGAGFRQESRQDPEGQRSEKPEERHPHVPSHPLQRGGKEEAEDGDTVRAPLDQRPVAVLLK